MTAQQTWREGNPFPTQRRTDGRHLRREGDIGLAWVYPLTPFGTWAREED